MYSVTNRFEQVPFLRDLLQTIRKRVWIITLTVVVFVGVAIGFSYMQTPIYEVSGRLLVGQNENSERVTSLGSDIMGLQEATHTVATAVNSTPVATDVASKLDLRTDPDVLLKHISIAQVENTQFIEITYTGPDPHQGRKIVDAFGTLGSKRIAESSAGASGIRAEVWESAQPPEAPIEPNPIRNGILAVGLGLMLGFGLTFLLEYLDDGWRSTEEVESVLGVPIFGVIPGFDLGKIRKMRSA
jgi:capsular polysaccharide biosynthesis protein